MIEPRLFQLIENLFKLLFIISSFFSVGILIWIGIMYILAKSEEEARKIHQTLPLFFLGLVLILLSFTIPKIIEMFFK